MYGDEIDWVHGAGVQLYGGWEGVATRLYRKLWHLNQAMDKIIQGKVKVKLFSFVFPLPNNSNRIHTLR